MKSRDIAVHLREQLDSSLGPGAVSDEPPLQPRVPDHELLRCIGRGNYGEVWLARSITGQFRAVKVVWRRNFSSERPYDREFQGIVRFEPLSRSHPGVVPVLHVGRDDTTGFFYYVMELADAAEGPKSEDADGRSTDFGLRISDLPHYSPRTLRSDLKQRGHLPINEVLQIGVQIAGALGHLHQHGLVHRDVKPSNVIYINARPRLADIGLVAGIDEARSFVGTQGFIPPEGPGTPQADLFALGKLLYEAATGCDRCDFPSLPEDLNEWSEHDAVLELNEVLARACSPAPRHRHANAAEIAGDLNLLLAGRSIRRTYSVERRLRRFYHVAIATSMLALAALGGMWFQHARRDAAERRAQHELALRERAEHAEQEHRAALRSALLEQARSTLQSLAPQRRSTALAALTNAAGIRPGADLRTVAAQALATPEVRAIRSWPARPADPFTRNFDATAERRVTGEPDGTLSIRSVADDSELARLAGSGARIEQVEFTPDGQWLFTRDARNQTRLWHIASCTNRVSERLPNSCWCLSPDSRLLVAEIGEGRFLVEDLQTGARRVLTVEARDVYALALHPNQPLAAIAQWNDNGVAIISLTNGTLCARYPVPGGVTSVAWHPAGSALAAGGADSIVRVWSWPGDDKPVHLLRRHKAEVVNLKFHPSGRWLLSQGWDDQNCLWNMEDAHLAMVLPGVANGFSMDGTRLTMQHLGKVVLAEFEGAVQPRTMTAHEKGKSPSQLAISPDGRWLVTAGYDGAWLWTTTNWQASRRLWTGQVIGVGFSETPSRIYVVGRDKWRAWELSYERATADELSPAPLPWRPTAGEMFKGIVEARSGRWLSLEWNASRSRPVLRTGLVHSLAAREVPLDDNAPADLALSPDGRWAACGNWHGQDTWVLDLSTNRPAQRLPHVGNATVEFTPDSRYLVIGGRQEFRFLQTGEWEQQFVISRDEPDQMAGKIQFAHHSGLAALHASRSRIRLVRWEDGQEYLTLTTPEERHLSAFAFTPDDRYFVITSADHHLLVWDLQALNNRIKALGLFEPTEWSPVAKAAAETSYASSDSRSQREKRGPSPERSLEVGTR